MMPIKLLAKTVEKFVVDNAPGILTGVGAVGAVATTYLTAKATFKAVEKIQDEGIRRYQQEPKFEADHELTVREKVKVVWPEYIPPAIALTTTVAAIVCANRASTKRIAALAAAYSLSERNFGEYKAKVVEKFNGTKEQQVRDSIAQDHVDVTPPVLSQVIFTGSGEVLCHDLPTGRYFMSDPEKIRQVQNEINHQVNTEGYAALTDFYVMLKLDPTPYSDHIGWVMGKSMLAVEITATLTEQQRPCLCINYTFDPLRGLRSEDPPF